MTSMCNAHTLTISGVDTVIAAVGLLGRETTKRVRQVIRGASVKVPRWINREGLSVSLSRHGSLTFTTTTIIANAQKFTTEALVAPRGQVANDAAELAGRA
jgi:hypothetical protein